MRREDVGLVALVVVLAALVAEHLSSYARSRASWPAELLVGEVVAAQRAPAALAGAPGRADRPAHAAFRPAECRFLVWAAGAGVTAAEVPESGRREVTVE